MDRKFVRGLCVAVALVLCLAMTAAYAAHKEKSGKQCYYKGKSGKHGGDLESKFYKKAYLVYSNQDELGLSDEQAKKIKSLKMETKKDLIRKKAEIEILGLDIKSMLWEDVVNAEEINKLIDKKYELKKEKAKALVAAYATLKISLSEAQRDKLKELCKQGKE
jgi:hypothetical protein